MKTEHFIILKFYENFEFFEIIEILKFLDIENFTFFVIWLADLKWNLVSGWTTLKPRIDPLSVNSLWGTSKKVLFRPNIAYHLINIYY
jgi:hypothetical protein